ncbi:hypothetical protein A0H81_04799 [Grifola frondosa]|uniref:1-phosphatidylinositol phosphodiesterase n=1 Tax=Grifola frondosa TaxID=5627 RepID=A0A1C7MG67_GRIFR|nr:hypothetical protein A0H81_04799 [Grifola frondosa]
MKKFTIFNHTSDIVSKAGPISLTLTSQPWTNHLSVDEKESSKPTPNRRARVVRGEVFTVNVPIALGATWKVVEMPSHCPWRIYRSKISKRHHKLSIFPRRELSSFLAEIPDTVPLSALMLPGTHDALAFYGWPISQCQSLATPLSVQLHTGIRVIDIRLAVKDSRLISYHGSFPQRTPFKKF